MTRRWPLLGLVLATLLLAGCGDQDRPAEVRPRQAFVGVTSEDSFAREGAYRTAQLRRQARSGVTLIRQTFSWASMEPSPGRLRLGYYDRYVADAARAGMAILPILFAPPTARQQPPSPEATATTTAPPTDMSAMGRWAQALVRRYGSNGTLWRDNPRLPRHPIVHWQVWNEPNLPAYWNGHPSPAGYVRMLRFVGSAIREADPRARVVSAGLTESRLGTPFAVYLRQLYRRGFAAHFDVLAVNAYSESARGIVTAVTQARRITAAAEDGAKPIWLTEFGWATPPSPRGSFTVGEAAQARLVSRALTLLDAQRARLRLLGVIYYQWRDAPVYPGGTDYWGLHTGLLDRRGRAKPSLRSFARVARAIGSARN